MNLPINILILMESHQENEILFVCDCLAKREREREREGEGGGGGNVVPSFYQ